MEESTATSTGSEPVDAIQNNSLSLDSNILNIPVCSGFGQYHSAEPDPNNPRKKLTPYIGITFNDIKQLVDTPSSVDKSQSQWVIPSSLHSRNFKQQEEQGYFSMLWADIDETTQSIQQVEAILKTIIADCQYEIYTSRSASETNQKCRILIPLANLLDGSDWILCQKILNDKLEANGIKPDRVSERPAQLCYLPNRGEFYKSLSNRAGSLLDAESLFAQDIEFKKITIVFEQQEQAKARAEAEQRRANLQFTGNGSSDLIGAFNSCYSVGEILLKAGYLQRGDTYCHPETTSGSYGASVKGNRVHSLNENDPLYSDGKGAHDSFSAFTVLFHNNDTKAAMKDAGDHWLAIEGVSWNKVKQKEYAKAEGTQALLTMANANESTVNEFSSNEDIDNILKSSKDLKVHDLNQFIADVSSATGKSRSYLEERRNILIKVNAGNEPTFDLGKYSLTGQSGKMKKEMLDEIHILKDVAILGQITVIYAKPNTGKTLLTIRLLIDSIQAGTINADDIYYINADDSYNGLVTKLELAEQHGFNMLAPSHCGFEVKQLVEHIHTLVKQDTAKGKIIILDTLKKFTDLMDKKMSSTFMTTARAFSSNGGSLILLAHTNKNRSSDGKAVAGGTSDIIDDADCAFILDEIDQSNGVRSVQFENIKLRGNVSLESGYSYSTAKNQSYKQRIESIISLTSVDAENKKIAHDLKLEAEKDQLIINAILFELSMKDQSKNDLVSSVRKIKNEFTIRDVRTVIEKYEDKNWYVEHIGKNSKIYTLSKPSLPTEL